MGINEDSVEPLKIYQREVWLREYNREPYRSIRQKILDTFKDLVFIEDGHKYFLGDRELMCVSNMTHVFKEQFDADKIAPLTYAKHYNDPKSPYFGKTVEEIKEMWIKNSESACNHGSERHEFGESLFHFMVGEFDKICPEFKDRLKYDENGKPYFLAVAAKEVAAVKAYNDIPDCLVPILAETKVYNIEKDYAYSGTFDILFYYNAVLNGKSLNGNGLYVLDWKTNGDIFKNYNQKKLLPPFDDMYDMDRSMYVLQLNSYQMALEKIGLKVIARRLFWLLPDGNYKKISLENITERLNKALIERYGNKKQKN